MREATIGDVTSLRLGRDLAYFKQLAWSVGLPLLFSLPFSTRRLRSRDASDVLDVAVPLIAGFWLVLMFIAVHEVIAFHRMAPWTSWMHDRDGHPPSLYLAVLASAAGGAGGVVAQHTILPLTPFGWGALVSGSVAAAGVSATMLYLWQFRPGMSTDGLTEQLYRSAGFNLFIPEARFIREWTTSSSRDRGASQTLVWGTNSTPMEVVAALDGVLLPAGFERDDIDVADTGRRRAVIVTEYRCGGTAVKLGWLSNPMPSGEWWKWLTRDPMDGDRATIYVTVANGAKAGRDGPWMPPFMR